MKATPALLAVVAAGVAAFVLFRPRPVAAATPGLFDSVHRLGDALSDFVGESIAYASRPAQAQVGDVIDPYKLQRGEGDRVTVVPIPPGDYPVSDPPSWFVPGQWPPAFPYGGT